MEKCLKKDFANMSKEKRPITTLWKNAKRFTEEQNKEKAVPLLETMIVLLAEKTLKGETMVEGVKIDLWKERAWLSLEQLGCLPEYRETEGRELGSISSR